MADNNTEEPVANATAPNGSSDNNLDAQESPTTNVESNSNSNEQEPKNEPNVVADEPKDILDKSKNSAKILLIFVNICTILCSLILFGIGVMMAVNHARIQSEWSAAYGLWNSSILCIVISLILAGVGAMGLMGAIQENRCLLIAFSTVLGLLICMEIALGVSLLALAKGRNLGLVVNEKMLSSMKHYEREGHDGVTKVWDVVQTELSCCGVTNATDWFRSYSRTKNRSKKILPESCCATKPFDSFNVDHHCTYGDSRHPHNKVGCLGSLEDSIKRNEGIIAAVIVVVALGQIGLIVASVHLMKITKKPTSCQPCY